MSATQQLTTPEEIRAALANNMAVYWDSGLHYVTQERDTGQVFGTCENGTQCCEWEFDNADEFIAFLAQHDDAEPYFFA